MHKRKLTVAILAGLAVTAMTMNLTACGGGGGNGAVKPSTPVAPTVTNYNENVATGSTSTIGDNLAGAGNMTLTGGGTLVLTGTNTFTGGTTITSSTLQLGNGGTTGSIVGDVADNGTLVFDRSDDFTFDGIISGTGALVQAGTGTLALTGDNTFTGGTTISAGTLKLGNGGTSGSIVGNVTDNAALVFDRSDAVTYDGVISGTGSLTQAGAGTLTLTGKNTYTGTTTISSGTLALAGDGSVASFLGVDIDNAGVLDISGATGGTSITNLQDDGAGKGLVVLGRNTLTITNAYGGFGFSGTINGTGGLTLAGGSLSLGGDNVYTGLTTIDAGTTLNLGFGGRGSSLAGDVLDNGVLEFLHDDNVTYGGVISGTGSLVEEGAGKLTLTGANTFSGGISVLGMEDLSTGKVTNSTLAVSSDSNLGAANGVIMLDGGTLESTASFTLAHALDVSRATTSSVGGTVQTDAGTTLTVSTPITGYTGTLNKTGSGTLVLTADNTYGGGISPATTISEGTLQLGNGGTSGSVLSGITDNAALVFDRSDPVTYAGVISGTGSVTQTGSGALTLTGFNSYSGGTTITADTLQIGDGGTDGSIAGDVLDNGTLVFDHSDGVTFDGIISGAGALVQAGTGTLTLTGNNTFTGGTTINAGTLQLGNGGTTGSIMGDVTDNAALVFDRSDTVVYGSVVSGAGSVTQAGTGTLRMAGTNTYSGGTNITGGVLQVFSDSNLGSKAGHVVIDGGTLQAGGSFGLTHEIDVGDTAYIDTNGFSLTLAGWITGVSPGQGMLVKNGTGTLTIDGGGGPGYQAINISAGTLALSYSGVLGAQSVHVENGAIFDVSQASSGATIADLSGMGTIDLGAEGLYLEKGTAAWTFDGVITDSGLSGQTGGGFILNEPNVTGTLTGVSTYTGLTSISSGTLALSGDGSIADSDWVSIGSAGALDISGTTSGTTLMNLSGSGAVLLGTKTLTLSNDPGNGYGGVISGSGGLAILGGSPMLTGANTYTGPTTISAGAKLQVGNGSSGSIVGDVFDNGSLAFDRYANVSYSGVISGVGEVVQKGSGTLLLTGENTYTGGTTISAGTLQATQALPGDAAVNAGGTLDAVSGVAGDLSNAGKVAVHSGNTSVTGNFTQASTGTLAVSLGSNLAVNGTATLNGGTLEVTGADSGYVANTHTDVLTATGGVTGTFDQLVKDSGVVFTSTTIGYGSNEVWLDTTGLNVTVAARAMGIVDPASVSAARRVQLGFDAINASMASGAMDASSGTRTLGGSEGVVAVRAPGDVDAVDTFGGVVTTQASRAAMAADVLEGAGDIQHSATPAIAHASLQSLSGQLHAASAAMLFDGIDASGNAVTSHFDDLLAGRVHPGVWENNLGAQGNLQRSGYAGATFSSSGVMAGADMRIGTHAVLGVAAGQSRGFGQLDAAWDHNRTSMENVGVYGGLVNGPWYANARVATGWYREDMQRLVQLGSFGAPVGSGFTGRYVAGSLEGGRMFNVGMTRVVPFVDVRYQSLNLGGFAEQGAMGFGLEAGARTAGRLQTGVGLRAARSWRLANGMRLGFDGSAGWRHTLHQYGSVFDASFTGFSNWLPVEGVGLSRDTTVLRAGLSIWPSRNFGLRLGFTREQGQRQDANSALLQGVIRF